MKVTNCLICDNEPTTADVRMRYELRGICLLCAEEGKFYGMTVEETARCIAMLRVIRTNQNATPEQHRHMKDMES